MAVENVVKRWVHDHDIECDSCGKPLTEFELQECTEVDGAVDAILQCGWCWQRSYVEFAVDMA